MKKLFICSAFFVSMGYGQYFAENSTVFMPSKMTPKIIVYYYDKYVAEIDSVFNEELKTVTNDAMQYGKYTVSIPHPDTVLVEYKIRKVWYHAEFIIRQKKSMNGFINYLRRIE